MTGTRTHATLVIDARPRGPRGALAGERVRGRTVLHHLSEVAGPQIASVHVHAEDEAEITGLARRSVGSRCPSGSLALKVRSCCLHGIAPTIGRVRIKAARRGRHVMWSPPRSGGSTRRMGYAAPRMS